MEYTSLFDTFEKELQNITCEIPKIIKTIQVSIVTI